MEPDNLLLIVVGAHLRAEAADRPLAYALRDKLRVWLRDHAEGDAAKLSPLVCSDVWYLNTAPLHRRPTISIGDPAVNALAAFLYPRLPTALHIDRRLTIQLDVELADLRANIWGADHEHTEAAVRLFEEKYLPQFMSAAAR